MTNLTDTLSNLLRELIKSFKILSRNTMGMIGFIIIVTILFLSFIGPSLWPPEASANVDDINLGVSLKHPLGADFQGQDNLIKVINGGRDIVTIAFITGITATLIAVVVGSTSAFLGGRVDDLIMSLVNIWLTIPKFPLLAVLATVLKLNVMLDLGTPHIIFRELLPNMMSFIAIATINTMTFAIYQQTGLVFLGIVPYSSANWGVMISAAERRGVLYNPQAMWSIIAPMGAIVLFQLGLVSFARSLDEIFNPRLRTSV
ncbi:MAG: ABC transporter permease [Chloroflexi bacterium]|nr:ABC transporter permease [Chloroflexota bacterium]